MTTDIASSIQIATQMALADTSRVQRLISEAGKRLEDLLSSSEVPLQGIQCVYSHYRGGFYISLPGDVSMPCSHPSGSLTQGKLVPHARFQPRIFRTKECCDVRMHKETAEFLNGLLERPFLGLTLQIRTSGGGEVIGEDGEPTGEWPGLGYLRFDVHSGLARTHFDQ